MAMSDAKLLEDLTARVERLEQQVAELLPKELARELYGEEVDHTEDRQARAAIGAEKRGPGRPPGPRPA
jgi:hypothetical protein